jgi:hypothetical protein
MAALAVLGPTGVLAAMAGWRWSVTTALAVRLAMAALAVTAEPAPTVRRAVLVVPVVPAVRPVRYPVTAEPAG